ncbi:MAG TPA: metallophosphatase domain-containing protein [Acidobacteriaceae bacterium]|nr:metallophosphatase domain-containing protein [Acidobacteriaceae bacterium]
MSNKRTRTSSGQHKDSLTLVLLSDTHELHSEIDRVPPGDTLIHAGDFTMFSRSLRAIVDFNHWLGELPYRHKIVVPGNHETFLQTDPGNRKLLSNATVLINEAVNIAGLRIWGSPVTRSGPAFGVRSADERRLLYSSIPEHTDVLITHGPPFGVLDCDPGSPLHQGDPVLLEAVMRVRPRLHVFGHIHGGYGVFAGEHTTFANAALLGPGGDIDKDPIVLRIAQL